MRVVQALHWLKDTLPQDRTRIVQRLRALLADDPQNGPALRQDLRQGLRAMPAWMQAVVREVLDN